MAKDSTKKHVIEVPAKDYQPTRAEMEEPISVHRQGREFRDALQRILRPADGREISAEEWRKRRDATAQ